MCSKLQDLREIGKNLAKTDDKTHRKFGANEFSPTSPCVPTDVVAFRDRIGHG